LGGGGCLSCENNSEIWTPNGYVDSIEKYQNLNTKNYNSELVYLAYVQPINSEPYGTLLIKNGHLFGDCEKPTNDDCGQIFRKIQCSNNSLHHPSFRHVRCNEPACPICYVKYSARIAAAVTERVQGFKTVYRLRKNPPYHLIFWSSQIRLGDGIWGLWSDWLGLRANRPYAGLRAAFKEAKRLLGLMGVDGAVVWYHPYRIKTEIKVILREYKTRNGLNGKVGFWKLAHDDVLNIGGLENYMVYGPHWHAIATGWLMNAGEYNKIEGAGYKKKRYLDEERKIYEVSYYISTHACREWGKSTVRYYGTMSYRMLARELVEEKIKDVLCQDCKSHMEEWEVDENGDYYRETERGPPVRKIKDKVTEKIKYYIYWIRGTRKPEMFDRHQCLVTRFCPSYNNA
jgi:hypothetical protein